VLFHCAPQGSPAYAQGPGRFITVIQAPIQNGANCLSLIPFRFGKRLIRSTIPSRLQILWQILRADYAPLQGMKAYSMMFSRYSNMQYL